MPAFELSEQARFIFRHGRVLRDYIDSILARQLAAEGSRSICGELSVAQLNVVMLIQRRGHVSITGLSSLLGVSPPSASAMVDRLVEKGVLTRQPSPEDRRRMEVKIAPAVAQDFARVEQALLLAFEDLVQKIGPEAASRWCEVLAKLKTVIEAENAPAETQVLADAR